MVPNRGEHVQDFAPLPGGIAHAIGRHERQAQTSRYPDGGLVARLFLAIEMPLKLHVDVAAPENLAQPLEAASGAGIRGAGLRLPIADCRLPIENRRLHLLQSAIVNRKSAIPRPAPRVPNPDIGLRFDAGFQVQPQSHLMGGERTRLQARAKLIEQPAQDEGQRLEQRHRILQLHDFFEVERRLAGDQRAMGPAARQLLQAHSLLSQALGKLQGGQRRERLKRPHAPAVERFKNFPSRRERVHRQAAQALRFLASGDQGYSPEAPRRVDRGIGIRGHGHAGFEPQLRSALGQAARDLFGRAEQLLQPGEVERQRIDRGVFNARRNGQAQVQQRSVRSRFLSARAMPNLE